MFHQITYVRLCPARSNQPSTFGQTMGLGPSVALLKCVRIARPTAIPVIATTRGFPGTDPRLRSRLDDHSSDRPSSKTGTANDDSAGARFIPGSCSTLLSCRLAGEDVVARPFGRPRHSRKPRMQLLQFFGVGALDMVPAKIERAAWTNRPFPWPPRLCHARTQPGQPELRMTI